MSTKKNQQAQVRDLLDQGITGHDMARALRVLATRYEQLVGDCHISPRATTARALVDLEGATPSGAQGALACSVLSALRG